MRRLLALLWVLLAPLAHASNGDCTVSSIGAGANAAASSPIVFGMPGTIIPGDLMLLYSGTFSATGVSSTDPTGYTLIKQGGSTGEEVWGKIAGRAESDPGITWNGGAAGYIAAIHNAEGWKNEASILGDSATNSTGAQTTHSYGALSVTQGGNCAFQFGKSPLPTGNTNQVTSVGLTAGYTAAGFAARNTVNGVELASQFFATDATAPDLAADSPARNTNTDSVTTKSISLTLLSGDKIPAAWTTFTDVTGATPSTVYTHSAVAVSGFDNWTDISVTGSTCEVNPGGTGWVTSGYINVAETFQVRGTAPSAGSTLNCAVTIGGVSDTYSITSASVDDSLSSPYSWTDKTAQELSSVIESAELQFTAFDSGTITVSGDTQCEWDCRTAAGSYDGFSAGSGTVTSGDYCKLHVLSSVSDTTATNCTSTIGTGANQSDQFRVTTGDSTPTSFAAGFTDLTNQSLGAVVTSNCLTIGGTNISSPVTCTVLCNVNGGAYSAAPGSITNGQQFCARLTTSSSPSTAVNDVVTVGGQSDTFTATTAAGSNDAQVQRLVNDLYSGSGNLTAHSPDVNIPGNAWTVNSGSATVTGGKVSLAASSIALLSVGTQDILVDQTFTFTGADIAQLETRATDHTQHYRCRYNQAASQVLLQIANAGVTTLDGSTVSISNGDHRLTMWSVGSQHVCVFDGVRVAAAASSVLTDTKIGIGTGATAMLGDNLTVMRAYKVLLDDTGAIADDPQGLFQGDTGIGGNSLFAISPTNLPAQHSISLYQGGSMYVDAHATFVGDDDFVWERYNSTSNAIDTGTVTIRTTNTGAVGPDIGTIPTLTCNVNSDPGPVNLTNYMTVTGQPAPTWLIQSGSLATGRIMDSAGTITGPCTAAGSFSAVVRATNATGLDTAAVSYTASEIVAGTLPTCTDIPNLYGFVGDIVSRDLNDYCDNVEGYSSGTLASGLVRNGSVISGTLTTPQHIITQFSGSNQSGTAATRWMQDVRAAGSDCGSRTPSRARRIFGHNECRAR